MTLQRDLGSPNPSDPLLEGRDDQNWAAGAEEMHGCKTQMQTDTD